MPEQLPDRPSERHPVLTGLLALVGVALVVGVILGFVVLAGARMLGLDNGTDTVGTTDERSMYVPLPQKTAEPSGPEITLATPGSGAGASGGPHHAHHAHHSPSPDRKKISLSASVTTAAPMEQFDLTGVYPGGEGAILQVQRFTRGSWEDFPVTTGVSNQTFSVPVQTSQTGVNRFRVVDTDTHLQSNEVRVTIG